MHSNANTVCHRLLHPSKNYDVSEGEIRNSNEECFPMNIDYKSVEYLKYPIPSLGMHCDSNMMRAQAKRLINGTLILFATYFFLSLVFDKNKDTEEYDARQRGLSRGLSDYINDKDDDANLVVDLYIQKNKPRPTSDGGDAEEDEVKDMPDLEVPNWNIVHSAEDSKIEIDDKVFKEQLNKSEVDSEWLKARKDLLAKGEPKKVFILAYMRGGSTLLGQVFNHDPEVIVWYEPLASFYGSLYGLPKYRHYRRIVFPGDGNFKSEFREIGKWESDNMVHYLRNLFKCNLPGLPRETLTDVFLTFTGNMQDYSMCYYNESRTNHPDFVWETKCKESSGMAAICSGEKFDQAIEYSIEQKCQRFLIGVTKIFRRNQDIRPDELSKELYDDSGLTGSPEKIDAFYKHEQCMQKLYKTAQQCLDSTRAEASCTKTSVRAAKVLRLKMRYIEPVIRAMPDIFVVHYFRDPRAIARSRVEISNPEMPPKLWANATKRMCLEMEKDISAAIQLKKKYPGAFLNLKYEDVVVKTKESLGGMYKHFGRSLNQETYEWVADMMHANEDDGAFGVKRKNASSLIDSWRHSFPQNLIDDVNQFSACNLVLTYLGYEF
ncbi:hypothetical protein CAPTEDRAFT_226952 [Capitella teleta]|uniref:Sulfotransferase domain-containing protein n=1 Tax=Capitella teleta TaxID=283909 RepID=R7V7J9_CAPTE|nr:hypothetical protein CAPTEDRAFT_226952 [Capitella teleta]|eukprot:ELU14457.1 hypothetical protein CAPTEDRAFT_226952 [Capitella teleta]